MRDVEFAFRRLPADRGGKLRGIGLREDTGHHRAHGRIAAQPHDRRAHRRVGHLVMAVGVVRDGVGIMAVAERRPGLFEGGEPGLIDELVETRGRTRSLACAGGLRFDSMRAVVSRYSKLAPVERAASRMAPATRAEAAAVMESIAISGLAKAGLRSRPNLWPTGCRHPRTLSILGNYGK